MSETYQGPDRRFNPMGTGVEKMLERIVDKLQSIEAVQTELKINVPIITKEANRDLEEAMEKINHTLEVSAIKQTQLNEQYETRIACVETVQRESNAKFQNLEDKIAELQAYINNRPGKIAVKAWLKLAAALGALGLGAWGAWALVLAERALHIHK